MVRRTDFDGMAQVWVAEAHQFHAIMSAINTPHVKPRSYATTSTACIRLRSPTPPSAGCSVDEIMAITGHRSAKMALHYTKRAQRKQMIFKHEFLGRCQTCLDNAFLDSEPCPLRLGLNGYPVIENDCLVRRAQAAAIRALKDKP